MPTIKGNKTETQDVSGTGKTWTVVASAKITGEEMGIFEDTSSADNRIEILGSVTGVSTEAHPHATAVYSQGIDTEIEIAKSAKLSGYNGIVANGDGVSINNAGRIASDGNLGISIINLMGTGTITNSGKVTGDAAIYVSATGVSVTNTKSGTIIGDTVGVQMESFYDGQKLINAGKIVGGAEGYAVLFGEGDDKMINSGKITGVIDLRGGDDTFDFRKGKLSDYVFTGDGNDTVILHKAGVRLFEQPGDGFDTVKAFVSHTLADNFDALILMGKKDLNGTGSDGNNEITGNAGKNSLKGMDGDDWLDGGKGSDSLKGGDGADTFVLDKGTGKDTVTDFEDGTDHIFVSGYPDFDEPGDVEGHIEKHGDDTWVRLSSKDILVLKGVDADLIDSDDFNFTM